MSGKFPAFAPGRAARLRFLLAGTALAAPVAFAALLPGNRALASCDQVGSNVSCTGTTFNYNAGTQTNLNVTVQSGATVIGIAPTDAIRIQNSSGVTGNALTNNGTIDGFVTILSVNPGTDTFVNNGVLKVTDPNSSLQDHSMVATAFTQSASGTFIARVDANGFNDGIFARSATLNGSLVVVIQPGIYVTPLVYDLITTTAGVAGQFSSVTSSSPFFSLSTATVGNGIDLTVNFNGFNTVAGLTPNQQAVANALQGAYSSTVTGAAATFYGNLSAATSVGIFDLLSGEGTSAAQDTSFTAGNLFNTAMLNQGMAWLNGAGGGNSAIASAPLGYAASAKHAVKNGHDAFAAATTRDMTQPGRWRAWAAGFGATRSIDGEANSSGSADQSQRTAGGAAGLDYQAGYDMLIGFAVGGSGSSFSVPDRLTSGHVDGAHAGAYAIKAFGPAYLAATMNYARLENTTERSITGFGGTENLTGRFNSHQLGGRLELGWKQAVSAHFSVTPFVAAAPAMLWQHAYTETSTGVAALDYRSNTVTSLPVFTGAQFNTRYVLAGGNTISPFVRLAWVHETMPDRRISASFVSVPVSAFTVDGARAARNAVRTQTGATIAFNQTTSLFANFDSELSSRGRMYAATAGAKVTW